MSRKNKDRPQCPFQHTDCFAWMKDNKCFCLDNTDFGDREECTFYKNDPATISPAMYLAKYKEEK